MASPAVNILNLDDCESSEAWLLTFEAKLRSKQRQLKLEDDEKHAFATDYILSQCGQQAVQKLKALCTPQHLDKLTFVQIKVIIEAHIKPREKLTIAERMNFLSLVQCEGENEPDFLLRL